MNRIASIINQASDAFYFGNTLDAIGKDFEHTELILNEEDSITELLNAVVQNLEVIKPELLILYGSSKIATLSFPLKKLGYTIVHVGSGIRSNCKRLPDEIDRTVSDHCSDYHFVYHEIYGKNLLKENLPQKNIFVTGNPIHETSTQGYAQITEKATPAWFKRRILLNITHAENTRSAERLSNLLSYAYYCGQEFEERVTFVNSPEAVKQIRNLDLTPPPVEDHQEVNHRDLASLTSQAVFTISDSETTLYQSIASGVPVVVPTDYPLLHDKIDATCSTQVNVNSLFESSWRASLDWVEKTTMDKQWTGDTPSQNITDSLKIITREKELE